jgi:hypothetical protein
MTVKNIYYFRNGGYDARMVASKRAPLESELFGSEGRKYGTARNEKAVKPLKTNNSAKSLIRRS